MQQTIKHKSLGQSAPRMKTIWSSDFRSHDGHIWTLGKNSPAQIGQKLKIYLKPTNECLGSAIDTARRVLDDPDAPACAMKHVQPSSPINAGSGLTKIVFYAATHADLVGIAKALLRQPAWARIRCSEPIRGDWTLDADSRVLLSIGLRSEADFPGRAAEYAALAGSFEAVGLAIKRIP